jgi:hypothetical protein
MRNSSKQAPGTKCSHRQSLCLNCSLAYGHLCFSVPFADRDWVLAYEEQAYAGSHEPYIIRLVTSCSRYERTTEVRRRKSERGEHGDCPYCLAGTRRNRGTVPCVRQSER